jgi:hypothetical protein
MACDCTPLLEEILREVRELRTSLQPQKLTSTDIENLRRLLPAVGGLVGSEPFRVWEILIDPGIAAISPDGPSSTGTLLARASAARATVDGYMVERVGKLHNATTWRVVRGAGP